MSANPVRVFFALWPQPHVGEALDKAARDAQFTCGGRATPRERIHLTLFFIGDTERARLAELHACAHAAASSAFELRLETLGYWRHNRIVWAGTRHVPAQLEALVSDLRAHLARVGFEEADRPYVPHVTLVRKARRAPGVHSIEPVSWPVNELALVESLPAGGSVRYDVIGRWPLSRSV